jgi:enoyl-CoA hydratase/carnithine racemase
LPDCTAFGAGFDISPREKAAHDRPGRNETYCASSARIYRSWGALNGYCVGGGCDLSMTCDYTVAADTAQFGEPEIEFCSAPPFLIMPWCSA